MSQTFSGFAVVNKDKELEYLKTIKALCEQGAKLEANLAIAAEALKAIDYWLSDLQPSKLPCCFPMINFREALAKIEGMK